MSEVREGESWGGLSFDPRVRGVWEIDRERTGWGALYDGFALLVL